MHWIDYVIIICRKKFFRGIKWLKIQILIHQDLHQDLYLHQKEYQTDQDQKEEKKTLRDHVHRKRQFLPVLRQCPFAPTMEP